ncbi:MAG TPA: ribonuclease H-like domain-containing protein [Candidatus Methylomirabilis sp.]|nr:ribonuclease H-like domain-containing protein [Candidatus Methylomirabilis sp.]
MARREIVLDIETKNTFQDVGAYNPSLLDVSLVGVYFYETDTFESFLEEDLPKLWPRLERADRIIGYNIIGFDLPCLQSYYTGELLKLPTLDIMFEIANRLGFRIKLDDVAQATLGIGKTGHGLQAVEFWKKGEIQKLRDYCLQDVKITRDVYEYALVHKEVRYLDRMGQVQLCPLPIDPVLGDEKPAINLSLGL